MLLQNDFTREALVLIFCPQKGVEIGIGIILEKVQHGGIAASFWFTWYAEKC